jgi:hypothetical protein
MTTDTTNPDASTPEETTEAIPADGRWGIIQLMGYKTIAGRAIPDELLGGGTVLVQTPAADGVTLRKQQSFQPSGSALYLATWCSREEVLDFLYPPVRQQAALTRPNQQDEAGVWYPNPDEESDTARDADE